MNDQKPRLSLPRVLAFSGVGIPLAAIGLPMAVFVAPLYAEELGLGTTLTGLIFMFLRFWDLGTDPVMGWLVDTRPTRFGRIKHWLVAGIPILGLGGFFVFMPGETVSPAYLIFWLGVLWLGFTMVQTPHQSWVPIIAHTYDDRSRMFMWREVVQTATLLMLLIIPTILAIYYESGRREQVMAMGTILLISLPITIALAVRFVPDPPPEHDEENLKFNWQLLKLAFRDPIVLRILLTEILVGIAIASTGGTFLFVAQWGFGVSGLAPVILMAFFVTGFAAMPVWTWLSRHTEKHITLIVVCIFSSLAFTLYLPFSAMGGDWKILLLAALISGLGYGTPFILTRSMMADVIEREKARSSDNRAGFYYSLMSGANKTGASFAIGIPYVLLGAVVGFDPNSDNSPQVIRGLMYVFVGVPVAAYALTALTMWKYPLTRKAQAETAAQLAPGNTPD